jgi:hypothetical protein
VRGAHLRRSDVAAVGIEEFLIEFLPGLLAADDVEGWEQLRR